MNALPAGQLACRVLRPREAVLCHPKQQITSISCGFLTPSQRNLLAEITGRNQKREILFRKEKQKHSDLAFVLCRGSGRPAASLSASPLRPMLRHLLWQSEKQRSTVNLHIQHISPLRINITSCFCFAGKLSQVFTLPKVLHVTECSLVPPSYTKAELSWVSSRLKTKF